MEIRSFKDLVVWQRAKELAVEVYRLTKCFPRDERFGLTLQLRRAAVSVSSNIAEGHARQGKEFAYFLSIANGSTAEVESQLLLSVELGYLREADLIDACKFAFEIRRMIAALLARLESRQNARPPRTRSRALTDP